MERFTLFECDLFRHPATWIVAAVIGCPLFFMPGLAEASNSVIGTDSPVSLSATGLTQLWLSADTSAPAGALSQLTLTSSTLEVVNFLLFNLSFLAAIAHGFSRKYRDWLKQHDAFIEQRFYSGILLQGSMGWALGLLFGFWFLLGLQLIPSLFAAAVLALPCNRLFLRGALHLADRNVRVDDDVIVTQDALSLTQLELLLNQANCDCASPAYTHYVIAQPLVEIGLLDHDCWINRDYVLTLKAVSMLEELVTLLENVKTLLNQAPSTAELPLLMKWIDELGVFVLMLGTEQLARLRTYMPQMDLPAIAYCLGCEEQYLNKSALNIDLGYSH